MELQNATKTATTTMTTYQACTLCHRPWAASFRYTLAVTPHRIPRKWLEPFTTRSEETDSRPGPHSPGGGVAELGGDPDHRRRARARSA